MARTEQDAQEAPAIEDRAAEYERQYRELQDAAYAVEREARRLLATPDARALMAHGQPWLPVWNLRNALDRFETAQKALLPSPVVTVGMDAYDYEGRDLESSTVPIGPKG